MAWTNCVLHPPAVVRRWKDGTSTMVYATPLPGRARIVSGDPPSTAGSGVLVTSTAVLTSREAAHDEKGGVRLDLTVEFADDPQRWVAEVVAVAPIGPTDGDLVLLRLRAPAPLPAASLADRGGADLDVRLWGYPSSTGIGIQVRARAAGPPDPGSGRRRLSQVSEPAAVATPGFRGAGVYDHTGTVIGWVVPGPGPDVWMLPVRAVPGLRASADTAAPVVAEPLRRLTFAQKSGLAGALGELAVLAEPSARQLVLQELPSHLRAALRLYGTPGADMFSLVRTTLQYPNGFADLYAVLRLFEGPTVPLRRLRDLAVDLGLLPGEER